MHRLFVAIRPPSAHRAHLLALMGGVVGARWQNDEQLHLTLRFIGNVDRHQAQDIADALGTIHFAPFTASLSGVGVFDRRGMVDTLWAGLHPHQPLTSLHHKVDRACVSVGLPPEQRTYLPHITMARFGRSGGQVDSFLAAHTTLASAPFTIDSFTLFESHLSNGGAQYHSIEEYRCRTERPLE